MSAPAIIEQDAVVKVYENGMSFNPDITFAQWEKRGKQFTDVIRIMSEHIRWWLGDWIIFGETKFKDKYTQALDSEMYSLGTLRNIVYVCRNVPMRVRNPNLSFDHHYEVARLTQDMQAEMLARADANKWTVKQLRACVRGDKVPDVKCLPDRMPDTVEDAVRNALTRQIDGGFTSVAEDASSEFDEWLKDNEDKLSRCADEEDAYRMVWRSAIKATVNTTIRKVKEGRSK